MLIQIQKEDVIEGLQKAASIIPQKTGAAYLRSIWLRAEGNKLELLSTDSNIEFRGSYTATVKQEGLLGVQGRAFVELIRRLPSGEITLRADEAASVLHIEQGRRQYKLPTNDKTWFQSFSDFPESGAVMWSGDFLQELIDRVNFCIGEEGLEAIACMILKPAANEKIEAAGMNGHQFAMVRFSNDELRGLLPPNGILIQKKYLNEMKKWLGIDEIDMNLDEKRLYLRTTDKKESLSLPLSAYQYPDYHTFLARLDAPEVASLEISRGEAQEALQRSLIFNTESNRCTYFQLTPTEVILTAAGQDVGSATETLDVTYHGAVERIAFPTHNLLSLLDHFNSAKLTLSLTGSEGPCGVRGEDDAEYLVIIMPMKILDDTQFSEEQV